jgi:tight adherence protein B
VSAVLAAAVLCVLAVWLLTAPGRRGAPLRPQHSGRRRRRSDRRSVAGAGDRALRRGLWRQRDRPIPIGEVLVEVAARLRSGADVESAWQRALAGTGIAGPGSAVGPHFHAVDLRSRTPAARTSPGPDESWLEGERAPSGVPGPLAELAARVGHGPDAAQVAGAIAACRIAHRVGTPLADVLERCASGLVESAEAASARRTALAGPRSTARLLAWLPLAGVLLGTGLGADPLGVLLGGGIGGWCLVLGVGLVVAGRRWVATLVRRAERAGGP